MLYQTQTRTFLKKGLATSIALILALAVGLAAVSAAPGEQTEAPSPFQFLVAVLADANEKDVLPNDISDSLADWLIENLIAPRTGETPEQVRERLSVEGQSTFQFLTAVLTDANEKDTLPDSISDLLSDLFIENFIAPRTGETPEQIRARLIPRTAADDRAALVALYNATDGPNWTNSANWLSDRPLSEWAGIDTDSDGRVTGIDLWGKHLSGRIPSELGNLSNLEWLSLGFNQLSGPVPTQLGNLASLKVLALGDAHLTGPIPPELGNLSNLERLNLGFNQLSGPVPFQLGNLSNLESLNLRANDLTGPIPSELGNLSKLTQLALYGNDLSGRIPSELGRLYNLTDLRLNGNELNGPIPPELGNISNLIRLELGSNELNGPIPPELGRLSNLKDLDLGDNDLSGQIPSELGNLSNLTWLYLGGNHLSGCVPAALRDVEENYFDYLGLPFCDGSPVPAPRYSIETRDREYGYTIAIPDGWIKEGENQYSGQESGGTLRVRSQELESGTTLEQYAQSVRDNMRQEWWPSASLFEVTSFQKEQVGNQEFYSLRYRVQESPMYCALAVQERIYLADSLPGNPHGFRVSIRFCDWQLESADARRLSMRLLDSFRIANQPASYYTQFIDVEGITVKASDRVRSVSMYNAAEVIETMMTSLRGDIQECLIRQGAGLAITPFGEYITTLPEFTPQKGKADFAAGLGAV